MSPDVEQGYLIVADVSGYTGFLARIGREHAAGALAVAVKRRLCRSYAERELRGDLARLEPSIGGATA